MSLAVAERTDADPGPVGASPGTYVLPVPETQHAWQLPTGGDYHNTCEKGDVRGVQWSPDAKYLVAEIDSGRSITLCLYGLNTFDFNRGGNEADRQVTLRRVAQSGVVLPVGEPGGVQSARDAAYAQILETVGASDRERRVFMESEPRWAPSSLGERLELAFGSSKPDSLPRAHSVLDLRNPQPEAWMVRSLDGNPTRGAYFQPVWVPPRQSDLAIEEPPVLITLVSGQAKCGKANIVTFLVPREGDENVDPSSRTILTEPCRNGSGGENPNIADRYPAWDPASGHDRLAFVRVDLDTVSSRICVMENVRAATSGHLRCDLVQADTVPVSRTYPAWSRDGRYLVYYVTRNAVKPATPKAAGGIGSQENAGEDDSQGDMGGKGLLEGAAGDGLQAGSGGKGTVERAGGVATTRLELLDFGAEPPSWRVLLEDVRPNPFQGPPMLFDEKSKRSWVLGVVPDARGSFSRVVALRIDGADRASRRLLDTGLENIKVLDVIWKRYHAPCLAIAAQGYLDVKGADVRRDKVFVMRLPMGGWDL